MAYFVRHIEVWVYVPPFKFLLLEIEVTRGCQYRNVMYTVTFDFVCYVKKRRNWTEIPIQSPLGTRLLTQAETVLTLQHHDNHHRACVEKQRALHCIAVVSSKSNFLTQDKIASKMQGSSWRTHPWLFCFTRNILGGVVFMCAIVYNQQGWHRGRHVF